MPREHLPQGDFLQHRQLLYLSLMQFNHLVLHCKNQSDFALLLYGWKTNLQCPHYFRTQVLLFCPLCISQSDKRTVEQIPVIEKLVVNALEVAKSQAGLTYCTTLFNYGGGPPYPGGFKTIDCGDYRSRVVHFEMTFSGRDLADSLVGIGNVLLFEFPARNPQYVPCKILGLVPPRRTARGQFANLVKPGRSPCIWRNAQRGFHIPCRDNASLRLVYAIARY